MPTYDAKQQRAIQRVFDRFERGDCRYVIPRGYRDLPASVPGSDIEVLIHADDFAEARELAEEAGFTTYHSPVGRYGKIARLGLRNPTSTLQTIISRPRYVASILLTGNLDTGNEESESLRNQVKSPVHSHQEVQLHLHNHLAYKSPMFDQKIRVSPDVEEGMIKRRRRRDNLMVPSPPDELLHLVCRGVFDYEGTFPEYYLERCEQLWQEVSADDELDKTFRSLLSKVFFAADDLVYERVAESRYQRLRNDLVKFSNY